MSDADLKSASSSAKCTRDPNVGWKPPGEEKTAAVVAGRAIEKSGNEEERVKGGAEDNVAEGEFVK